MRALFVTLALGALGVRAAAAQPAAAGPEPAAAPESAAPAPAGAVSVAAPAAPPGAERPVGLVAGVELGQPTSAVVGWYGVGGLVGGDVAIGSGTWSGTGFTVRADVVVTPAALPVAGILLLPHVGLGLRYKRDHYQPASIDELPDAHTGIRASVGVGAKLRQPVEIYLDLAPGYDLARTDSCSFLSGVDSICPHAQSSRGFFDLAVGARWWFGG